MKFSDIVYSALSALLGLDVTLGVSLPESLRATVLTKSKAIGEPLDAAVPDLNQTALPWTVVGTLKAFSGLFLTFDQRYVAILTEAQTTNATLQNIGTSIDLVNNRLAGIETQVTALNIVVSNLSATATDIRARMDQPFTTV